MLSHILKHPFKFILFKTTTIRVIMFHSFCDSITSPSISMLSHTGNPSKFFLYLHTMCYTHSNIRKLSSNCLWTSHEKHVEIMRFYGWQYSPCLFSSQAKSSIELSWYGLEEITHTANFVVLQTMSSITGAKIHLQNLYLTQVLLQDLYWLSARSVFLHDVSE